MPRPRRLPCSAFAVAGLFCVVSAQAQDSTGGGLPAGVLLLSRVEHHISDEFQRLSAVSCLETVQREVQRGDGKMRPLDSLQLEVLTNGDHELFASPGDRKFSEQQPVSYVGSGLVGNGLFGVYLKNILLNGNATTKYRGDEEAAGRRLARYDYQLDPVFSGQSVDIPEGSGVVGLDGSFWVDPSTYDVARLDLHADRIPPTLPITELATSIRYARTILGGHLEVLLPESAEVRMVKNSGEIFVDQVQFTQCEVFGAESKLDFQTADVDQPARFGATALDDTLRPLPAGLRIQVKLKTPISAGTTVGTLIDGVVAADVKDKHTIVIPAGAAVRGRVRRLERYSDPARFFVIGLEFTEVEVAGVRHIFYADLLDIDSAPGVELKLATDATADTGRPRRGGPGTVTVLNRETIVVHNLPGVATFFLKGDKLELPRDFGTVWKTRAWKP